MYDDFKWENSVVRVNSFVIRKAIQIFIKVISNFEPPGGAGHGVCVFVYSDPNVSNVRGVI